MLKRKHTNNHTTKSFLLCTIFCVAVAMPGLVNAASVSFSADAGLDFTLLEIRNAAGDALGSVPRGLSILGNTDGYHAAYNQKGDYEFFGTTIPDGTGVSNQRMGIGQTYSINSSAYGAAFPPPTSSVAGASIASAIVQLKNDTEDFLSLVFEVSSVSLSTSAYVSDDFETSADIPYSLGFSGFVFRNMDLYPDLSDEEYVKSLVQRDLLGLEATSPDESDTVSKSVENSIIQVDLWSGDERFMTAATVAGGEVRVLPIPSTVWLMGSALLGFGLLMKRKKPQAA